MNTHLPPIPTRRERLYRRCDTGDCMKYARLGRSGPRISRTGFGAWAVGGVNWGPSDDRESKRALLRALETGANFIDTADVYGYGHSEELIAEVLDGFGREGVVVATKAGNDFYHAGPDDDRGYGPIRLNEDRDYLVFAAERSLRRLGVETLDILQLHSLETSQLQRPDPWEALYRLKRDGKIRWAGWSVKSYLETEQAPLLDEYHELLDCIQVRYNLLERAAEAVLFPKAIQYGLGVIVRIPLLFGLLTGKFASDATFSADDHRHFNLAPAKLEAYLRRRVALHPLFEAFPGQSEAQVSLRFCLSHPATHTVIPGCRTPAQVDENMSAGDMDPIPPDLIPPLLSGPS
jgi:aryl-alcohol dehydrogenase-like predicted oxidoreductase